MEFYRQGDVGLVKVSQLPNGARAVEARDIILAYGEVTGHSHAIRETNKARLWDAGAERFLQVLEKTALEHEEHAPIDLDPGIYRVVIQREYAPQAIRRVQD